MHCFEKQQPESLPRPIGLKPENKPETLNPSMRGSASSARGAGFTNPKIDIIGRGRKGGGAPAKKRGQYGKVRWGVIETALQKAQIHWKKRNLRPWGSSRGSHRGGRGGGSSMKGLTGIKRWGTLGTSDRFGRGRGEFSKDPILGVLGV